MLKLRKPGHIGEPGDRVDGQRRSREMREAVGAEAIAWATIWALATG